MLRAWAGLFSSAWQSSWVRFSFPQSRSFFAACSGTPAETGRDSLAELLPGGAAVAVGAFTSAAIGSGVFVARLYRIRPSRLFQVSLRALLVLAAASPPI
jgi:hypothetical protein